MNGEQLARYHAVLTALTAEIRVALEARKTEENFPQHDPDKMDDRIRFYKERANRLIELRQEFEELMTEVEP